MENPFDGDGQNDIARRLPHLPADTVKDLIEDAWARAIEAAPCIAQDEFPDEKAPLVKALLRAVILRWADQNMPPDSGKGTHKVAGPYQMSVEQPQRKGFRLDLGETVDFRKLCLKPGRPFTIDTLPADFEVKPPLYGVVVNGDAHLNGPDGEWSEEEL
ncbi:hypothetical protein [Mycobacterium phage Maco6]|nr:hypothetical protein [Mycobacterium phage Maco6]